MATTNIQSFFGDVEVASGAITTNNLEINGVVNPFFPTGSIIIWYSDTIPTGWVLCDGNNGTPNLQGKYLLGANGNLGTTTNNYNVTLAVGNLPAHKHNGNVSNAGAHKHYFYVPNHDINNCDSQGWNGFSAYKSTDRSRQRGVNAQGVGGVGHNHNVGLSAVGSGQAFNIEPPYHTVKYIMKTA